MTKFQVMTGAISAVALSKIAQSTGFNHLVGLRRINGDLTHDKLPLFSGSYSQLFDSAHGILSMSSLLENNLDQYIPPTEIH